MLEADRNIQFCLFFGRLLLRLAGHLTGSGGRCGLVVFGVMGLRAADHNLALADFDATGPEGMPYRFPNDGPEHPRRGQHNAQTNDTEEKEQKVNGRHDLLENKAQKITRTTSLGSLPRQALQATAKTNAT